MDGRAIPLHFELEMIVYLYDPAGAFLRAEAIDCGAGKKCLYCTSRYSRMFEDVREIDSRSEKLIAAKNGTGSRYCLCTGFAINADAVAAIRVVQFLAVRAPALRPLYPPE